MSIIHKQFIKEVLQEEGSRLMRNQELQMRKLLDFHTNHLINSRSIQVSEAGELGGKLTYKHTAYQRFLDRKLVKGGRVVRKAKPIHNRYVFGHYYSIALRVGSELTEQTIQSIKNRFKLL